MIATRAKRVLDGFTQKGKPRVNQEHPELKGLINPEYHLRYMRKKRLHDKAEKIRKSHEVSQHIRTEIRKA